MDNKNLNHVWYVAYGSNLLYERFICYIKGGVAKGCKKNDQGCHDSTPPIKNKPCIINHELYFAKEGGIWGKGAASFLKPNKSQHQTYARQYLITSEQFKDIVLQENNVNIENAVNIDIDLIEAKATGEFNIGIKGEFEWYGRILYLGESEGHPMFTFTAKWNDAKKEQPNKSYLNTIKKGLVETYELSDSEISQYLNSTLKD